MHADQIARGVLLAGSVEIEYTVSGTGMPVLLLATCAERNLCAALAQRYRLIVPRLPPESTPTDLDVWLAALIDGLGLWRTWVVAAGESTAELASIAREHSERIAHVETVPAEAGESVVAELLTALEAARRFQA